jgi:hypothetical protein
MQVNWTREDAPLDLVACSNDTATTEVAAVGDERPRFVSQVSRRKSYQIRSGDDPTEEQSGGGQLSAGASSDLSSAARIRRRCNPFAVRNRRGTVDARVHRPAARAVNLCTMPTSLEDLMLTLVTRNVDVPYDVYPSVLRFRAAVATPSLLWRREGLSNRSDVLAIEYSDLGRSRTIVTLVGETSAEDFRRALDSVEALERVGESARLAACSEASSVDDLDFAADARFSEYVYNVRDQVDLVGPSFGRRRGYLRASQRLQPGLHTRSLDLASSGDRDAALGFAREWIAGRDEPEILGEYLCLETTLSTSPEQWLEGLCVEQDGEIVGLALWSVYGSDAIVHFAKAHRDSTISAYTWQALFTWIESQGAGKVNGGYDAGLAGLRDFKRTLRPAAMLPRYVVVRL